MQQGRPRKYQNRHTYSAITEGELYGKFQAICLREGVSLSDKLSEMMEEYVKVHGAGNPQYSLLEFENPKFKAVPALHATNDTWIQFLHKDCSIEDIEQVERKADLLRKVSKTARENRLKQVSKSHK